jgi:hypothetical protein
MDNVNVMPQLTLNIIPKSRKVKNEGSLNMHETNGQMSN